MKTKLASLIVVFLLITTLCKAQEKITVEAKSTDISNNLDLKAVSTAFGESSNLQEFEKKLNDYNSQISNLDLNNDGQVDYLRVVEKTENGIHVVEIQAVLGENEFQDVASIIVEKDQNDNPTVQVVGDPYLYGENYIIEPSYMYTPSIFSFFWGPNYFAWNSPYYWGYYPGYYHQHRPYGIDVYYSNVYSHINHNQRYYYTNSIRNSEALGIRNSVRRNDLGVRRPEQSFSNRNVSVRNKRDFEFSRNGMNAQNRTSVQGSSNGSRPVRAFDNGGTRISNQNNNGQTTNGSRYSNPRTYSTPGNTQNQNVNRQQNINSQNRPQYNQSVQPRTQNPVIRDNNTYRSTQPVRQQPVQVNSPRQQQVVRQQSNSTQQNVRTQQNVSTQRQAPAPRTETSKPSRSSDSNRR
jgi:hypothetical protein